MSSFPCWLRWVLSAIGGPGAVILVVALCILLLYLAFEVLPKRLLGAEQAETLWARVGSKADKVMLYGIGPLLALAFASVLALGFMQQVFGCDACLPSWLQEKYGWGCEAGEEVTK